MTEIDWFSEILDLFENRSFSVFQHFSDLPAGDHFLGVHQWLNSIVIITKFDRVYLFNFLLMMIELNQADQKSVGRGTTAYFQENLKSQKINQSLSFLLWYHGIGLNVTISVNWGTTMHSFIHFSECNLIYIYKKFTK